MAEDGPDPGRHGVGGWSVIDQPAGVCVCPEVSLFEILLGRTIKAPDFVTLLVGPRHFEQYPATVQSRGVLATV